jgi:hypothetical protein
MDRKQLLDVADVLTNLVRNVHLRRELSATRADPHLVFWRLIYGDLSDITVLEWCKLFGSDDDDHQPLHWKNVVFDPTKFRTDLFARLQIYESKWRSYWGEMKAISRSVRCTSRHTKVRNQVLSQVRPCS